MRLPAVAAAVAALFLAGCEAVSPVPEEELVLHVAASTQPCTGVGPRNCLLVRRDTVDGWSLFYDTIEGFEHEEGWEYTVRVVRTGVEDPPADGSSYTYRLVEILRRRRVEPQPG